MHSAIIYAILPSNEQQYRDEAMILRTAVAKATAHKSVKQLGDFAWEVNFQEGPDALGLLVYAIEQRKLPYAILPIAAEPQWIRRNPAER